MECDAGAGTALVAPVIKTEVFRKFLSSLDFCVTLCQDKVTKEIQNSL